MTEPPTAQEGLAKPTLTDRLSQRLIDDIVSGVLQPGQQLPTGQALSKRFGVSLSVVREAISTLKAEGMIQTRQGAGAFVRAVGARPFRLAAPSALPVGPEKVFELRTGIEMQAAALAAERGTAAQRRAIQAAYKAMEAEVKAGHDGVAADVLFHRRIAEAAGNELFASFLDFLGDHIRSAIQASREGEAWAAHQAEVMAEHRALVEAIVARDANAARNAARDHMDHCLRRCLPR